MPIWGSRIPEPLLSFTSRYPLRVQISQGLGPFFQIELLKTGHKQLIEDMWSMVGFLGGTPSLVWRRRTPKTGAHCFRADVRQGVLGKFKSPRGWAHFSRLRFRELTALIQVNPPGGGVGVERLSLWPTFQQISAVRFTTDRNRPRRPSGGTAGASRRRLKTKKNNDDDDDDDDDDNNSNNDDDNNNDNDNDNNKESRPVRTCVFLLHPFLEHHFHVWMWTNCSQNDALACTRFCSTLFVQKLL